MDPKHRISVNFATPRELRIIPGVGDKMAEAIVEMRLRNSNVTASLLSSILRKRLPEDVLACLDFRPNPNFAATDEQQDDGYGAVSLDYEDGYKAQLTEEIKREIENRLWPESSNIPKERGTVGGPEASSVPLTRRGAVHGPEAFFVPWTKPVYKMSTAMQEDPIHQDTVFPKEKTKKHKDDKSQSPKVRRKLNLEECSDESEGAEKKHRSTKLKTEHKSTKQKISAEDDTRKHSNKLQLLEKSDKFSDKDKYSLSKEKKKQKKSAVHSKKHRQETSSSSSSEDSGSDSDVVKKKSQKKSVLHTLPKQLQYDGKSNWLHFKHKFIKYAKSSDWTAEECLDCLSWCLTGKAADFCATLMERKRHLSYRKLMKRLDDRFIDRELPSSAQVRFQQATQKKEESLEDWADRVLTLSGKAFKELPEKYSNQQAVARFCQGLNDAEAGLCVCMGKPSSMGDALNEIKLYQHTKDAIYGHRKERTVSSRVTAEDLEDGLEA